MSSSRSHLEIAADILIAAMQAKELPVGGHGTQQKAEVIGEAYKILVKAVVTAHREN